MALQSGLGPTAKNREDKHWPSAHAMDTGNAGLLVHLEARCKLVFENRTPNPTIITQQILRAAQELEAVRINRPQQSQILVQLGWERPDLGAITVNCDAAWNPTTRRGGISVIARDGEGRPCGGRIMQLESNSIEELKALAIMEGVKFVVEERWLKVRIESDAEMVINHLKETTFLWRIDTIVANAKVIASSINNINWVHIPRLVNQCAKQAMQEMCSSDWVE